MKTINPILQYRIDNEISQRWLADECRLSSGTIHRAEHGGHLEMPTLSKIAKVIGIDIFDLQEQLEEWRFENPSDIYKRNRNTPINRRRAKNKKRG